VLLLLADIDGLLDNDGPTLFESPGLFVASVETVYDITELLVIEGRGDIEFKVVGLTGGLGEKALDTEALPE